MGFFDFLGTTLSGGGESYSKAVSSELANYRERGMQPYDRSIKRDEAISSALGVDQRRKLIDANERLINTAGGTMPSAIPFAGARSIDPSAVVNPPAQPMPTAPVAVTDGKNYADYSSSPTIPLPSSKYNTETMGNKPDFGQASPDKTARLKQIDTELADLSRVKPGTGPSSSLIYENTQAKVAALQAEKARLKAEPDKPVGAIDLKQNFKIPKAEYETSVVAPTGGPASQPAGMAAPSGVASDYAFIKEQEGFREQAYWDVNAWRVGYGSDTITRADGTVVPVTKDTVITREDAERDISRRGPEFAAKAADQIGAQWNSLTSGQQEALTSVAYNYGSLPASVVKAAKTGDIQALANAVASLKDNPDRRAREAQLIASGGSAAAQSVTSAGALPLGNGNVGLSIQEYIDDPNRTSLDLQITNYYQQQQQGMFDLVNSELTYAEQNSADLARTMGPMQYRQYVNGLRKQQMDVNLAAVQSRTTGAVLYAYQGLNLAQGGQTGLLNLALTEITGVQTEIIPRSSQDGTPLFYSLAVAGQPVGEPMPYDQLVQEVRTRLDRGYAESLMAAQAEIAAADKAHRQAIELAGYEAYVKTAGAIEVQKAQSKGELAVAEAAREKGLQPTGQDALDGSPIFQDPNTGFLYQHTLITEGKGSKAISTPTFERIYYTG